MLYALYFVCTLIAMEVVNMLADLEICDYAGICRVTDMVKQEKILASHALSKVTGFSLGESESTPVNLDF